MDCLFQATAPTEPELMRKIAEHVKAAHGTDPVPADLMMKIKNAIKK